MKRKEAEKDEKKRKVFGFAVPFSLPSLLISSLFFSFRFFSFLSVAPSAALGAVPDAPPEIPSGSTGTPVGVSSKTAAQDAIYENFKMIVEILNDIQQDYPEKIDPQKLLYGAASGMVGTLDPFSQFLEPRASQELKSETRGEFGGIGVRIEALESALEVVTALPGTPAFEAGLLPNDRIVAIDGESTRGMRDWDAVKKLRGAPGSVVELTVFRPAEGQAQGRELKVRLKREKIKIASVQSWVLGTPAGAPVSSAQEAPGPSKSLAREGRIGYLRVLEFNEKTPGDTLDALKSLKKERVSALILDLRNNPGGVLRSAVAVAGDFLPRGALITFTLGRDPAGRVEYRSESVVPYRDWPMVVLTNENSASGAEIVAGALQDDGRAVVVGERSYGKASVQSVLPLPNSCALRLTVAHYYTPKGRLIQRDEKNKTGGIVPDIDVQVPEAVKPRLFRQWEMVYSKGKKPKSIAKGSERVPDEALEEAQTLLRARSALKRLTP